MVHNNGESFIIAPLITEKANLLSQNAKRVYVFRVAVGASKVAIKKDIQRLFSVTPVSCSVLNVRPKKRVNLSYSRNVKRGYGLTSSWRKAYVTLIKGQTIAELEA